MPPTPSPTYERLRDYIARRMRMSHVVQPLMLMELLGRRSPAAAQDVARRILGEDVTQIEYYTERVKRMVGKVLTGNDITRYERGTYDLVGGEELSDAVRDQLLQLCRQRLDAFREQRGEEVGCGFPVPPGARTHASTGQATPIQERRCQRSGSWRPCRAITRISAPCSRK